MKFSLVCIKGYGPFVGQRFELREGTTIIGRTEGADIQIGDVTISRRHARLTVSNGRVMLEDAGSTSGIYVNHERFSGSIELVHGSKFQCGQFVLELVATETPSEEA